MPTLQAPCAGTQCSDGQRGCVVNIERQFLQLAARAGQFPEIFATDFSHTQQFGTDARLFGQDTRRQLVRRHFEAEESDLGTSALGFFNAVFTFADPSARSVEGDVGGKRCLAHTWATREDDKVGIVQAAAFGVNAI